jgi:hypothetical protein
MFWMELLVAAHKRERWERVVGERDMKLATANLHVTLMAKPEGLPAAAGKAGVLKVF